MDPRKSNDNVTRVGKSARDMALMWGLFTDERAIYVQNIKTWRGCMEMCSTERHSWVVLAKSARDLFILIYIQYHCGEWLMDVQFVPTVCKVQNIKLHLI